MAARPPGRSPACLHACADALRRRSAPCPLCQTPIVARELRLVRVRPVPPPPKPGDSLDLQLIRRGRSSIIPQPITAAPAVGAAAGPGLGLALSLEQPQEQGGGGRPPVPAAAAAAATPAAPASAFESNLFAKFVVVEDPSGLWRAAAEQLAACAAQVRGWPAGLPAGRTMRAWPPETMTGGMPATGSARSLSPMMSRAARRGCGEGRPVHACANRCHRCFAPAPVRCVRAAGFGGRAGGRD